MKVVIIKELIEKYILIYNKLCYYGQNLVYNRSDYQIKFN